MTYDMIVLDVMMPGEDGIALTTDLRRTSDIPVLLLTARTEAEDRIAGLEAGGRRLFGQALRAAGIAVAHRGGVAPGLAAAGIGDPDPGPSGIRP